MRCAPRSKCLSLELLTSVRLADVSALRTTSVAGGRIELVRLLDKLMAKLPELSDIVSRRYFSLTEEQPHRRPHPAGALTMKYIINHKTTYAYAVPVHQSFHLLHLAPRVVAHQKVIRHRIVIDPAPGIRWDGVDYFGNPFSVLNMEVEHTELVVRSESLIDVSAAPKISPAESTKWNAMAGRDGSLSINANKDIWHFAAGSRHAPALPELADVCAPVVSRRSADHGRRSRPHTAYFRRFHV